MEPWRPALAADVLWALALAHHWTPRLHEWEALLRRLGGFGVLTAREAASAMWAFATLGHAPTALLQVIAVCLRSFWVSDATLAELGVVAQRAGRGAKASASCAAGSRHIWALIMCCLRLQDMEAAGGWRFAHEPWQRQRLEGPRRVDTMSSKALAAAAWSLAAVVSNQLSSSAAACRLAVLRMQPDPRHVHADRCISSRMLQEQTNTAAFQELWQEIGRRGAEGMGGEQKTLMQVHQVGLAGCACFTA